MTIEHYTYKAGSDTGRLEHEDGTVEELYGTEVCGPDTKRVDLPEELGGHRVDVIHHMRQDCPSDGCDGNHSMLLLASVGPKGTGQLAVVECPKNGFLWCSI